MKKSILIKSEDDFNKVKNLMGDDLYFTWDKVYLKHPTAIVVRDEDNGNFGIGSIGSACFQKSMGFEILDTNLNIVEP